MQGQNDKVGASAYEPRVMLKVVLLAYSQGLISNRAIDSPQGRRLYNQRIGTVEPVFGNIRHNKRLTRLNLRGHEKVNTQWHLYCMVHNIEKLANSGWRL